MKKTVFAALFCLSAVSLSVAQWSGPEPVGARVMGGPAFVCAAGDTLWAFCDLRVSRDSHFVTGFWRSGGQWHGPDTVAFGHGGTFGHAAGVDHVGRIRLAWYDGPYIWGDDDGSPFEDWGTYTATRDSGMWSEPELAVEWSSATAHCLTTDNHGRWYIGFEELGYDTSVGGPCLSAAFTSLDGDSWTEPYYVGRGWREGSDEYVWHRSPLLVPRSVCGLWVVHDTVAVRRTRQRKGIRIDLFGEGSLAPQVLMDGESPVAAVDSAGRLRVVFVRDSALWCATLDGGTLLDEHFVSADLLWYLRPVNMCVDSMGLVWATWTSRDSSPLVSYSTGFGWAPAEPVTDSAGWSLGITSESDGTVHVLFESVSRACYTVHRLQRPAVGEGKQNCFLPGKCGPALVRGSLILQVDSRQKTGYRAELMDAAGRKVTELQPGDNDVSHLAPGVYFVGEAQAQAQARAIRKVVLTR